MTQEDKELLLKDICARLPYGIKASYYDVQEECETWDEIDGVTLDEHLGGYVDIGQYSLSIERIKPYLFPLSSMTDEQAKEIQEIIGDPDNACIIIKIDGLELWLNYIDTDPTIWLNTIFEVQDYLNKNHFDYRDLIEKGLAIEITGENNPYKE